MSSNKDLKLDKAYRNEAWLRHHYWHKKKSTNEIGKLCDVTGKTIFNWMKKFNIPRRSVSDSTRVKNGTYTSKKGYRVCNVCKKELPLNKFGNRKNRKNNKAYACKVCENERGYKKRYGITIQEKNNMIEKQNGKCAICGKHQKNMSKPLCVDHNHKTGEVREILCSKCNTLIGYADENKQILKNAIKYLRKHND